MQEAGFTPAGKWMHAILWTTPSRIFDLQYGEPEVFREFRSETGELHFQRDGNYFLYAVNDIPDDSSRIVLLFLLVEKARYRPREIRVGR